MDVDPKKEGLANAFVRTDLVDEGDVIATGETNVQRFRARLDEAVQKQLSLTTPTTDAEASLSTWADLKSPSERAAIVTTSRQLLTSILAQYQEAYDVTSGVDDDGAKETSDLDPEGRRVALLIVDVIGKLMKHAAHDVYTVRDTHKTESALLGQLERLAALEVMTQRRGGIATKRAALMDYEATASGREAILRSTQTLPPLMDLKGLKLFHPVDAPWSTRL